MMKLIICGQMDFGSFVYCSIDVRKDCTESEIMEQAKRRGFISYMVSGRDKELRTID